jgi:hypothetical protein
MRSNQLANKHTLCHHQISRAWFIDAQFATSGMLNFTPIENTVPGHVEPWLKIPSGHYTYSLWLAHKPVQTEGATSRDIE